MTILVEFKFSKDDFFVAQRTTCEKLKQKQNKTYIKHLLTLLFDCLQQKNTGIAYTINFTFDGIC